MGKQLSRRIEAIEYVHADDGLPYRHAFKSGGTITLLKDGSVKIRNRDKRLWDEFNVKGRTQPFLINPPAGRSTTSPGGPMATKRKKRKRPMSALQRKYFGGGKKRSRKRNPPAKRSRARSYTVAAAPARRRRRRKNPMGFSISGILGRMQRGAKDALFVVGGRAAARYASSKFDYEDGTIMDGAVEGVASLAAALAAEKVFGGDAARFVLAGGLSSAIETVIAKAGIPQISPLFGAYPRNASTAAIYAAADAPRNLGAWIDQPSTLGSWQPGEPLQGRGNGTLPRSLSLIGS